MSNEGRCMSCGAPVLWLAHVVTGRVAPIEASESPQGNCAVLSGGRYRVIPKREDYTGRRHRNHFQACPKAKQHSRAGRG